MSTAEEPWTIGRLLKWTVEYLGKNGAENSRLDAEVLLAHSRGCRRIDLYTAFGEVASEQTRNTFRELVKQRAAGKPVAYLVGHREFYSLDFEVTPDVLIPRPETESLVVALLDRIKQRNAGGEGQGTGRGADNFEVEAVDAGAGKTAEPDSRAPSPEPAGPIKIADVGTGSGIIAICAAKYAPTARVTAIDISPAALEVARRNAVRHNVADRIEFVEANLFSTQPVEAVFDFIVSNPPYVSDAEMERLAADVRGYEPELALRAGATGTAVVAPLIEQGAERLKPGGGLLIEISPMIATEVEELVRRQPVLELGATIKDLAGHARVVQATRRRN